MEKLVLIDGNAILHRAYHALPPLTTRSGRPINAVYGLVSMLLKVIQELKPTRIAVAFDEKVPTFRQVEFPQYQAHRPDMDDGLSSQFEEARRFFAAADIPVYSYGGFEADDVIGTVAKKVKDDVVVVTGDRDILQLVDKKVKLYMPVMGLTNAKLYGANEVVERMGVGPEKIIDYKALVGDPSDNYPGVGGVGPKTAIGLLEKYGNLEGVYSHLDEISKGVKEKLEKGKKDAYLSQKLATIVKNVPINFIYEDCGKWKINDQKVLNLFAEYGFKTLTERVKKVGIELDKEKQPSLL